MIYMSAWYATVSIPNRRKCNGIDPQQEKEKLARMRRLVNGTDETSITYL